LIWIAVILLAATMAGFIAGFVAFTGGGDAAAAILTGGGAFGTVTSARSVTWTLYAPVVLM
jgi:hypothetical protein